MVRVSIDGKIFPKGAILKWEQEHTDKMKRFFDKRVNGGCNVKNADEFADFKANITESDMRRMLKKLNGVCAAVTSAAVGLSGKRRKISVAEIDLDFCDSETVYNMFMDTMMNNTPENIRCNLRANPEHFLLKGADGSTQEVIEISGDIPIPEQFFIRYGDENGLVSEKEAEYPFQASGVAFLKSGQKIGGVRHQMKDTPNGCHIKLMVEFPAIMPNRNIKAHQYHLACEFYNWFTEFERRLENE